MDSLPCCWEFPVQELTLKKQFPTQTASWDGKKQREGCGHLGEVEDFGRASVNPAPFRQARTEMPSCPRARGQPPPAAEPCVMAKEPSESPTGLGFVTTSRQHLLPFMDQTSPTVLLAVSEAGTAENTHTAETWAFGARRTLYFPEHSTATVLGKGSALASSK